MPRDYKKALSYFDKAIVSCKKEKVMPSFRRLGEIWVVKIKLMQNDTEIDLNKLFNYAYQNKLKILDGWYSRAIAEILMINGGKELRDK